MSKGAKIVAGALAVVMLAGTLVAGTALAQGATPTPKTPYGWRCGFGFGRGIFGQAGLEAAAKALGMTADELSTQLWGGRTLAELADKAGVDLQTIRDAVEAANQAAFKDAIQQAVEDGYLTQEQADWLLKGLELGFMPMGRGFGRGFGFGGRGIGFFRGFAPLTTPSVTPSSSSL
ncbi:MAG: hypothetical protein H5T64_03265 [Chloroflexi bacterium]|nr:hypothetical protein [Chloroflexota bacterium]